jgi:SP family sugar:H+ symporter-like MFS transporter
LLRSGKFTEEEIDEEFASIVQATGQLHQNGSFLDIFKGTNLRRTMIVAGANFFFQATGQIFTSIYGAIYVKSLGTVNPFTITVVIAVVNVCTAFLAMALLDRVGRR